MVPVSTVRLTLTILALAVLTLAVVAVSCSSGDRDGDGAASGSGDEGITASAPATTDDPPPGTSDTSAPERPMPDTAASEALLEAACAGDLAVTTPATLPPHLTSVSGLAASRRHPGIIWAVEDSLEPPVVTALDLDGQVVATIRLVGGPLMNLDWEDLAVGPGPDGTPWVYVADIGDNFGLRPQVRIHRFPEPELTDAEIRPETVVASYRSGRPNAEAFVVDPAGTMWIIDKDPDGGAGVHLVADGVIDEVARLDLGDEQVTAADVSEDGALVALRTHRSLRLHRLGERSLDDALLTEGCATPPLDEVQGESVAFLPEGVGLVTVSEDEAGRPVDLHLTAAPR